MTDEAIRRGLRPTIATEDVASPGSPPQQVDIHIESTACESCGERESDVFYKNCRERLYQLPGVFNVVKCRGCGLLRTDPRPTRMSIGTYYPDSYLSFGLRAPGSVGRCYGAIRGLVRLPYILRYGKLDWVQRPEAGESRLLDIGCGTGSYLTQMAALGWEPWGVEPSAEAAEVALGQLEGQSAQIFVGSAEDAIFSPEQFDLVTMWHVLEHLHAPRIVLSKIHEWLRPHGRLRLAVPNVASFESRIFGRLWFGLDVPRHLHHFSPATLERLLDSCGFEVERVVPQYPGVPLEGSLYLVLNALLRRRRNYRPVKWAYYSLLPVTSFVLALGSSPAIMVTARKR